MFPLKILHDFLLHGFRLPPELRRVSRYQKRILNPRWFARILEKDFLALWRLGPPQFRSNEIYVLRINVTYLAKMASL